MNLGAWTSSTTTTLHDRLLVGRRGVWITGVIVALLTWQVSIVMPTANPDPSWMAGLYMALQHGKEFGNEIVFTYGPLGFLSWPGLWLGSLGILAFFFLSLVFVGFSVTLVGALEHSTNLPAAAVVTFLFLVTVPDLEQVPLLLAVGFCFFALRENPPSWGVRLLALGGGSLSAVECLIKLSGGPVIFLVCVLGMVGARASRKNWLYFFASSVGGLIALWLAAGQPLSGLGDYISNGAQIVSGYNEAMAIGGAETWEAVVLVLGALSLVMMSALAPFKDERARWFAVAAVAVAAFSAYKYGIVRFESGHVALAASALLGIWLQLPWKKVRATPFLITTALLGIIFTHTYPTPVRLDVISNLNVLRDSAELVVRPGLRKQRTDESRAAMQATYNIDPSILAALKGKTVSIEPWETGIAWAYELNWSPVPVFQNYVAYTSKLDELNADQLENPNGPERILRTNPGNSLPWGARTIEGRLPAWDPPKQAIATVCNFVPVRVVPSWQVLKRIPDRCADPVKVSSVKGMPGEVIHVPPAGRNQLVVLKIKGGEIEGLEKIKTMLWKPPIRTAVLNGGQVTYRLVPGTIGDGFIVSRDPSLDGTEGFEELPQLSDIRIEGVSRPLEYSFYRINVRPTTSEARRPQASG
ncbi:MAG: hypothetical protein JST53_18240 [Actinobacteria bacterium]|nr:hypothetical protein [Actinomycetota bacterium]